MFSVNYWGSEPGTNDDCYGGFDFETLEEALGCYQKTPDDPYYAGSVTFVELDGPGIHEVRPEASCRPERGDDDWKRECAMQAGMAFGCQGWNDYFGAS